MVLHVRLYSPAQPSLLSALTKADVVQRILHEQTAGERGRWCVHGLQPRPLRLPLQPLPLLRRRQVAELSRPARHQHRTRRPQLLEALGGADGAAAADAGRGGRPALAAQLLLARPPARPLRLPPRVSAIQTRTSTRMSRDFYGSAERLSAERSAARQISVSLCDVAGGDGRDDRGVFDQQGGYRPHEIPAQHPQGLTHAWARTCRMEMSVFNLNI